MREKSGLYTYNVGWPKSLGKQKFCTAYLARNFKPRNTYQYKKGTQKHKTLSREN